MLNYNAYSYINYQTNHSLYTNLICAASENIMSLAFETMPAITNEVSNYVEYESNTIVDSPKDHGYTTYAKIQDSDSRSDTYKTFITTIDFEISSSITPTEITKVQYFAGHTDIGYIPLYGGSKGTMRMWNNPELNSSKYDKYYVQFMGYPTGGQEGMIWEDAIIPTTTLDDYQILSGYPNTIETSAITLSSTFATSAYQYAEHQDITVTTSGNADGDPNIQSVSGNISLSDDKYNYGVIEIEEDEDPITIYYIEKLGEIYQVYFNIGTPPLTSTEMLILGKNADDFTTIMSGSLVLSSGRQYYIELTDSSFEKVKFTITRRT